MTKLTTSQKNQLLRTLAAIRFSLSSAAMSETQMALLKDEEMTSFLNIRSEKTFNHLQRMFDLMAVKDIVNEYEQEFLWQFLPTTFGTFPDLKAYILRQFKNSLPKREAACWDIIKKYYSPQL